MRRLNFSEDSPFNATLTDESGAIVYTLETPGNVLASTKLTNIYRASPGPSSSPFANVGPGGWGQSGQPKMTLLGQIETKTYKSEAVLRYGGFAEVEAKDFFRKGTGFWDSMSKKRYWNIPNGQEFVWNYEAEYTILKRRDEQKTPIAEYHNNSFKMLFGRSAYLEIHPEGEGIIDWIVFTFAYIHGMRVTKEATKGAVEGVSEVATSLLTG